MTKTLTIEQQNYDYCTETLDLKHSLELHFLEMGKRLMEIRDHQLYRPRWESFMEYLMDLRMERSKANRIINIYKRFVLEYKIAPKKLAAAGGWSVLAEVLPVVSDKASAEEWVEKATEHPQYELRAEIREAKGTVTTKKDRLSEVEGTISLSRMDDGCWYAVLGRDKKEVGNYGPAETLDDVIRMIENYE